MRPDRGGEAERPGQAERQAKAESPARKGGSATDYTTLYRGIDFRRNPQLYQIGRGEQGVLLAEPYKSELLPHWRFRTPEVARESAERIHAMYLGYRAQDDFVGMDMARKFLQMGYTRSRRYANHRSGRKYRGPVPVEHRGRSGAWGRPVLPRDPDPQKADSADVFWAYYLRVVEDPDYQRLKAQHLAQQRGGSP